MLEIDRARRRRRLSAALTLAALSSAVFACQSDDSAPGADASAPTKGRTASSGDSYYLAHRGVPVALAFQANQVGVIARERVGSRDIAAIARTMGLTVRQELSGGLFVLDGTPLPARHDALVLARELRRRWPQQIRDAGMVMMAAGETTPSVIGDEVLVRFAAGKPAADIGKLMTELQLTTVRVGAGGTHRVAVADGAALDAIDAALALTADGALFAEPNRYFMAERFETVPTDPLFASQWHLRNLGASGGTVDADVDASQAWDMTTGAARTIIAVVDNTFDLEHEDLAAGLHRTPGEIAGNGIDDNGNGFVDDVTGWDFVSGDNDPRPVAIGDNHGTAVTGVAVARIGNGRGVVGACPQCQFIPLTIFNSCDASGGCTTSSAIIAEALDYAAHSDAQIITNSWGRGPSAPADAASVAAIDDATSAGKLVLFAGGNESSADYCDAGYPSLPNVIAVSSSSNRDRKVSHARGSCIDVLAPSHYIDYVASDSGTLGITTTDRTGSAGYNSADPPPCDGLPEPGDRNYTNCFSGTSSATPLVAGIAGLLISVRPSLTRIELQRLLQDTSDKIEDSLGHYSATTGFSQGEDSSHSFGRVNAFEAVRAIIPGRGKNAGVDLFVRDNRLDWGNTEQPSNVNFEPVRTTIGHWQSPDIKVDAPPYQVEPGDAAAFDALIDEAPRTGEINKVYVRVRNRGPVTASGVTVTLQVAQFGTVLPALPDDFWSVFPAASPDTSTWQPLGTRALAEVPYSGASVAGCPGRSAPDCTADDKAQIAHFEWVGPAVDPGTPNHFCLFAVLDSQDDPIATTSRATQIPDLITPRDNNVTHRNVRMETSGDTAMEGTFWVRNPTAVSARAVLQQTSPAGWTVDSDGPAFGTAFTMAPGEKRLVTVKVTRPAAEVSGSVEIIQTLVAGRTRIVGGLVLELHAKE